VRDGGYLPVVEENSDLNWTASWLAVDGAHPTKALECGNEADAEHRMQTVCWTCWVKNAPHCGCEGGEQH
jgi:hypothetical protein